MTKKNTKHPHVAIMKEEVVQNLITDKSGVYLDLTVGFGGHAEYIVRNLSKKGRLIGLDCDPDAFKYSLKRFEHLNRQVKILNDNYANYDKVLNNLKIKEVNGILMDFGVSSYQIDSSKRGFSYQFDAPLDMRFDLNYDKTAFNVLNDYNEKSISNIIKHNGEERNYKKIAKIIVQYSKKGTMNTSFDLKNAIIKASPYRKNINKIFSRVFQAIRIEVNNEFENIENVVQGLSNKIKIGGKAVFLTFHSLEDRIIKRLLFKMNNKYIVTDNGKKRIELTRKKVIKPSREEILKNKRSRSAKLRFITITK